MPKFQRIPRVSIIVPLQGDEGRFEETLLSVLENQVEGCEVVAVHNGTYSDPFDLGDEVNFVIARSSNLVDLVRDGFDATSGSVVHVLGAGLSARAGWVDAALEPFLDNNVAAVAPSVVSAAGEVSGWCDDAGRLCQAVHEGGSGRRSSRNRGFYLNAFFARRRVLGNLLDAVAPAMHDPVAVSYAFGCLLTRAGWSVLTCESSRVDAASLEGFECASDMRRGQHLAAIRARVFETAMPLGKGAMLRSALLGSSSLGEMFGMMRFRASLPAIRRAIDPETVTHADEMSRLMELPSDASWEVQRRAA